MNDAKMITLAIDGNEVSVPEHTTIMDAAEMTLGVRIPRLCYHPDLSMQGACRVCIVEVKGVPFYMASCSVEVWEGMEVQTNNPEIQQARRDIVELLLDNHPRACLACERDANCELQNIAYATGVRERLFEGERKRFPIETDSIAVNRNQEKCILCGRCARTCAEVQGVFNLSQQGRGFTTEVAPAHGARMDDSVCIQCGQCINACPTAAITEHTFTDQVWRALADPKKHVVAQTAPAIRATIGEGFGMEPGTPCTGKLVTALRRLGFDRVFDTNFTADLTIVEEATELLRRMEQGGPLPLLTSCSPGWVNFLEKFYPELIPYASSCRSPMSMMSSLLKTWYAEKNNLDPKDIFVVAVMPCTAKKYESRRREFISEDGIPETDAVITTRELIWMIKNYGVNFAGLPNGEFDSPLAESSGAGDIFGATGGVMEAALRMAVEKITGAPPDVLEFTEVRAVEGLRERELKVNDDITLRVGVANGLTNAKHLLDAVVNQEKEFHIIEIMACPGGCIGGGGQPYPPRGYHIFDKRLLARRASALYEIDKGKKLRSSNHNPAVKLLYAEYLGEPGSEKAHKLLHTHYEAKLPRGIR